MTDFMTKKLEGDVKIDFYPRSLAATAVFIVAFGSMLSLATDLRRGVAVGILAVLTYLFIEVFVTINPAVWFQVRRNRPS